MLKAVNRQALEVCDTGNEYFEKAIFFVKPEYSGLGEGKLRERAKNILKTAGNPPKTKAINNENKLIKWLKLIAAGSAGAIISAIICTLILL